MKLATINALASVIALLVLVGMVTAATAIYLHGQDMVGTAIVCNLIAALTALAAWSGVLWQDGPGPSTWGEWVRIFVHAGMLSCAFVAIDMLIAHPGISLAFTIGALTLTFIALPSALRAWLRQRLSRQGDELDH